MSRSHRRVSRPESALAALVALGCALASASPLEAQALRVGGPDARFARIGDALAAAAPGDTIHVAPGVYRERLTISRPVTLLGGSRPPSPGATGPVIDGGGTGHVIEATAALTLRGFVIRASGQRVDAEDSGVMVRGAPAVIEDNHIEDTLYGIYLKDAAGSTVRGNVIRGKNLPAPRRGDGIRLWYSSGSTLSDNEVIRVRDVVIYFSDSLRVTDNVIRDGRYGLHYMYSDDNRFERNRFEGNEVGAFIMYSKDIRLESNVFANAEGPSGMGLALKDSDRIEAFENLIVENAIGVHLDNSPGELDATNRFTGNLVLLNGSGVRLLPSVRGNVFEGNSFVANDRPVEVAGGAARGQAGQNRWGGNHWSSYAGFDSDADGVGDTPFLHARIADELLSRHPELRVFSGSPALSLLDALGRFFPLIEPEPVAVDSVPRVNAEALERWRSSPPVPVVGLESRAPVVAGIAWGVVLLLGLAGAIRGARGLRDPTAGARAAPAFHDVEGRRR